MSAPQPPLDPNSRPRRAETPSPHHRAASRPRAADPVRAHARPRRTPSDSRRRAVSRSGAVEPLRAPRPHALKAQTANDRTPVCGQNPKEPRRRAAGAPGAPNRRIGAPPPRARSRKARPPAPPPGCGAGRIQRADLPKRIAAAASCGRGCPIAAPRRAEHDSRLPSPAPPIRFTTD